MSIKFVESNFGIEQTRADYKFEINGELSKKSDPDSFGDVGEGVASYGCSEGAIYNRSFYEFGTARMKLEICSFSGHKIYPAKGKTYVRVDSRLSVSLTKGMTEEVQKKRSRRTVKHERAVVGASWDAIRAKRNQKPDARAAARQAAISKSKDAKKAAAAAKKAANPAGSQAKVSKQQAKGFAPKAAATSR
ncbi:unnamed protein product [Mucor hiemalis]